MSTERGRGTDEEIDLDIAVVPELVGGRDGEEFRCCGGRDGRILHRMGVYWEDGGAITAIKVWLTHGADPQTFGTPKGRYEQFELERGEKVTRLSLWPCNGRITKDKYVGYLSLATNRKEPLDYGVAKCKAKNQEHPIDVGSGICLGVTGRSRKCINALALVFLKPVASSCLMDVKYPNLSLDSRNIAPVSLEEFTTHNDEVAPRHWQLENSREVTSVSKWSISHGFNLSNDLCVSAEMPTVSRVQTTVAWKLSRTSGKDTMVSEKRTLRWQQSGMVPAGKTVALRAVTHRGEISTDFTGAIEVMLQCGQKLQFPVDGHYLGISFTGVYVEPNIDHAPPVACEHTVNKKTTLMPGVEPEEEDYMQVPSMKSLQCDEEEEGQEEDEEGTHDAKEEGQTHIDEE